MEWEILEYETNRGERPVEKQKQKTPRKEINTARTRLLSLT